MNIHKLHCRWLKLANRIKLLFVCVKVPLCQFFWPKKIEVIEDEITAADARMQRRTVRIVSIVLTRTEGTDELHTCRKYLVEKLNEAITAIDGPDSYTGQIDRCAHRRQFYEGQIQRIDTRLEQCASMK